MPKIASFLQNHLSFVALTVVIIFVGLTGFALSTHSQSNESAAPTNEKEMAAIPATSPSPTPTPHDLVGSFYTVQNGTNARLILNKGPVPLEVSPDAL